MSAQEYEIQVVRPDPADGRTRRWTLSAAVAEDERIIGLRFLKDSASRIVDALNIDGDGWSAVPIPKER